MVGKVVSLWHQIWNLRNRKEFALTKLVEAVENSFWCSSLNCVLYSVACANRQTLTKKKQINCLLNTTRTSLKSIGPWIGWAVCQITGIFQVITTVANRRVLSPKALPQFLMRPKRQHMNFMAAAGNVRLRLQCAGNDRFTFISNS